MLVIDTERSARAADGLHRRHAVHRRRGPSRSRRRPRLHAGAHGGDALRLAARESCSRCPTTSKCIPRTAPARCAARTSRRRPRRRSASSAARTTPCSRCRARRSCASMTADLPKPPRYFGWTWRSIGAGAASLDDLAALSPSTERSVRRAHDRRGRCLDVRTASISGGARRGFDQHRPRRPARVVGGNPAPPRSASFSSPTAEAAARGACSTGPRGHRRRRGFPRGGRRRLAALGWPRSRHRVRDAGEDRRASLDAAIPPQILDVRRRAEYDAGHPENAVFLPLDRLAARDAGLRAIAPGGGGLRRRLSGQHRRAAFSNPGATATS